MSAGVSGRNSDIERQSSVEGSVPREYWCVVALTSDASHNCAL